MPTFGMRFGRHGGCTLQDGKVCCLPCCRRRDGRRAPVHHAHPWPTPTRADVFRHRRQRAARGAAPPDAPTTADAVDGTAGAPATASGSATPAEYSILGEQFKQLATMTASSLSASATDPATRAKVLAAAHAYTRHAKRILDAFLAGYVEGKNLELREFLDAERAKLVKPPAIAAGAADAAGAGAATAAATSAATSIPTAAAASAGGRGHTLV